jgi:hypothetical protein
MRHWHAVCIKSTYATSQVDSAAPTAHDEPRPAGHPTHVSAAGLERRSTAAEGDCRTCDGPRQQACRAVGSSPSGPTDVGPDYAAASRLDDANDHAARQHRGIRVRKNRHVARESTSRPTAKPQLDVCRRHMRQANARNGGILAAFAIARPIELAAPTSEPSPVRTPPAPAQPPPAPAQPQVAPDVGNSQLAVAAHVGAAPTEVASAISSPVHSAPKIATNVIAFQPVAARTRPPAQLPIAPAVATEAAPVPAPSALASTASALAGSKQTEAIAKRALGDSL